MLKRKVKWVKKTAVITGAGSGIGRATAIALAEKGATVHLVDRDGERITALVNELSLDNVCGHTLDVTVPEQMEQLAKTLQGVDILINCAGILHQGAIASSTLKECHKIIDVNLWGVIHSIKAFLPYMSQQKQGGNIVNIASIAGLIGAPEMALYNTSKFALLGLSESLAIELAPAKIKVTAICPGSVNTSLSTDGLFASNSTVAQTLRKSIQNGVDAHCVALDIIRAIRNSSSFELSRVEPHWQLLWLCKRTFPFLYPKLASIVYHNFIDPKITGSKIASFKSI